MNRIIAVLVFVLFMAGCSPMDAANFAPVAMAAVTRTSIPTATIEPSATVDYIATADMARYLAQDAQRTSDAAARLLVDATMTHESIQLVYAGMTQSAEQVAMQSGMMTREAAQFTATAFATSVPMTQTQQAKIDDARGTERAMTITAPTQIVAMANAQALAETETYRAWADVWVVVSVGVTMILIGIGAMVIMLRQANKREEEYPDEIKPIPFTHPAGPTGQMGGKRIRAEIQCTNEQIVKLCDGILHEGKTLAFNQWKGTDVYANLNNIRHYFLRHLFAYELQGKGGELTLTDAGREFVEDCAELKTPPLPHVCVG